MLCRNFQTITKYDRIEETLDIDKYIWDITAPKYIPFGFSAIQSVPDAVYGQATAENEGISVFWKSGNILENLDSELIQQKTKDIDKLYETYSKQLNKVNVNIAPDNSTGRSSETTGFTTYSSLYDYGSYSTISGNIRIPVGSSMKPEKVIVKITDTATKNNPMPVSRFTYPDRTGRFVFDHVPTGVNYMVSVEDTNNITSAPNEKPIFASVPKDIGSVGSNEALIVQDIGYFYRFDFNNNGIYNESGEADYFFDEIANAPGVSPGNYLYSVMSTTALSDNSSLSLDKDDEVNIFDASSVISGGTWLDNPGDPNAVDINKYNAAVYIDTMPSTISAGTSGQFTLKFADVRRNVREDAQKKKTGEEHSKGSKR